MSDTIGGIVHNPASEYNKELAKFEQFPSVHGPAGNPHQFREYPKMIFRAQKYEGQVRCGAIPPNPVHYSNPQEFERVRERAIQFDRSCHTTVNNDAEEQRQKENGYRETADEAVAAFMAKEEVVARGAAERHHDVERMSPAAQKEVAQKEAAAEDHLEVIPETPLPAKRRCIGQTNAGNRCARNATDGDFCKTHSA